MIELKVFQVDSAKLIADRYAYFTNHADRPGRGPKTRPFFQALSAITGAGKTPILAQAVSLMRLHLSCEPIVLWMSKAKPVVAQTYNNFLPGGKYNEILEGFNVINISGLAPERISDASTPLLIMTTTGLFNNKDQSEGALNIYKRGNDLFGSESPWERLISRTANKVRRPLIIVYDEGHNLSEQQTELLAELEPDAYLLASATLKLPENFQKSVIQPIKLWVDELKPDETIEKLKFLNANGKPEAELFTTVAVSSQAVVEAQLVKKAIQFDGTTAAMEFCINELMNRMKILDQEIKNRGLGFKPKAIYVCRTNIADDGEKDDASKPFIYRKAPPIRIWQYLVHEKGVLPKDIAIFADLKFVDGNKPDEVNLFSRGENDFDEFYASNFQHIVFNLSLQEGWDDPACYLAYIDKSMGSSIQVEQIIGRVLRQYGAEHYENPLLNSAHFFLRVDKQSIFTEAIEKVKSKLESEGAPIEISQSFSSGGKKAAQDISPKKGKKAKLHHIFVDSSSAEKQIATLIDEFPVFAEDDANTIGEAERATKVVELMHPEKESGDIKWKKGGNTNPVRLRWLVSTAIKARSSKALTVVDLKNNKFDVRVQVQSRADKQADELAKKVVSEYFNLSVLAYESHTPYEFGMIRVSSNPHKFKRGLYSQYSGFNIFELDFAKKLDEGKVLWHRNSSVGGFYIPLLSEGDTAKFYPDFIVWKKGMIFCLDTKGGHLLSDAVARKLFDISEDDKVKLKVRFITEGKQSELRGKAIKGGYSVWKMKSGNPVPVHVETLAQAVEECLK